MPSRKRGRLPWRMALAAVLAAITANAFPAAQSTPSPLTQVQLVATLGTEADARAVFSKVLADAFRNRERQEYLLASQIRQSWLPSLDGVALSLISDAEARSLAGACGRYWIVQNVRRSGSEASLILHRQCGGTTLSYTVSFDGQDWRLGPAGCCPNGGGWAPGIGSGYVGSLPPECRCDQ